MDDGWLMLIVIDDGVGIGIGDAVGDGGGGLGHCEDGRGEDDRGEDDRGEDDRGEDDRGEDADGEGRAAGGLDNMRRRAEELGGAFTIGPARPRGTVLTWSAPV
jgi:hypothetical protein